MPPPCPGLATANRKTTRDASDRLLQSTFQRRAPVLREKTSSLAGHKALWSPVGFASHALHPLRPTASSPRRAFSSRPDLRDGWTSDTPVTARHPTTLLATPFARRPRPPSPSLREERWLQTTQGVFRRRGALPRPSPVPRCCHPDLAVDVPSPRGVSSVGLGPRPPSAAATAGGFSGPDASRRFLLSTRKARARRRTAVPREDRDFSLSTASCDRSRLGCERCGIRTLALWDPKAPDRTGQKTPS